MRKIGKVYCHVGNSGATFEVIDEGHGPTLQITTNSFGNLQHSFKLHTDCKSLREIGEMLTQAGLDDIYSKEYCIKGSTLTGECLSDTTNYVEKDLKVVHGIDTI